MFYEYQAKNKEGEIIKGVVEAGSLKEAQRVVEDQGLVLISLREKERKGLLAFRIPFIGGVKTKDVVIFSRQLAVMVSATLPLVQSLRILVDQTQNVDLKSVVSSLADEVEGGAKLSEAMSKYSHIFSDFYLNMIRSGETSGKLDEVLNYLADQQEKDYDLQSKIKGAMIYPAFIIFGLLAVGTVMMVFVVPKLTGILKEAGRELPLATRILIFTSDFLVHFWWVIFIGLISLVICLKLYMRTKTGRKGWDFLKLKLPIFGSRLFQKIYLVRLTRSLLTLIQGGVPLTQALGITQGVVGNAIYQDLIEKTMREVEDGRPLASVFLKSKIIPAMLSQMLNVGEETGRLDEILKRVSDFYTREIDNTVTNLTTLIEPLIMVVLGLAVGVMVAAIIMPMYNLASGF